MRPTSRSGSVLSGSVLLEKHPWKSPVPYLFGGLALMLLLIFVALVILLWSYRHSRSSNSSSEEDDHQEMKATQAMNSAVFDADQPKIIVIINAGEDKPTQLATPVVVVTSTCSCSSDQV